MGSGSRTYVNDYERAVNVSLRYVGLVDTAHWERVRKVRDTEWHEFIALGAMKPMATDDLPERNADSIKKAFPRCRIMTHGIMDVASENGSEPGEHWFVRFKMNAQTLSKLLD